MTYITPDCDRGVIGYCNYIRGTKVEPLSHMVVLGSFIVILVQTLSIFTSDRAPAMVRPNIVIVKLCQSDSELCLKNTLLALMGAIFHLTSGGLIISAYMDIPDFWVDILNKQRRIGFSVGSCLILQAILMLVETVLQGKNMKKLAITGLSNISKPHNIVKLIELVSQM